MEDFDKIWAFVKQSTGLCLVHCEQGVNRSGAVAVAAHMRSMADEDAPNSESTSPDEASRFHLP